MQKLRILMLRWLIVALIIICFAFLGAEADYDPEVYQAQKILKKLGYKPGTLDGFWGNATKVALQRYQMDMGLPISGRLDAETKARLVTHLPTRGIKIGGRDRERRIALVIGNGAYESAPLANPVNDARDIADALRNLGFEVIERINADERQMVDTIDEFYRRLRRADVGLFYFAGHGLQIQGGNYLIPVGSHVTSESDVLYEAVEAGRVLGKMKSAGNKLNIVILDACRDNPFKRSFRTERKGLAQMDAPKGTIVAYATSPGSVAADGFGRNGIYTKHLLQHIKRRELSVQELFMETGMGVMQETGEEQIPWVSSTPIPRYYLAGGGMIVHRSPLEQRKSLLEISANVSGAGVFVDGRRVGTTPLRAMEVAPGGHRIRVEKPGYTSYQKNVQIETGRTMSIYVDLSREEHRKGRLFVEAHPADAAIRVLNLGSKFYQGMELDEGKYQVEVMADGYETQEAMVTILPGEDKHVAVRLKGITGDKAFTDRLDMQFVFVPEGSFMMGSRVSPEEAARKYGGKAEWYKDEHPWHEVKISQPFDLLTTEVTVGQWRKFVRDTGYKTEAETGSGAWVWTGSKWEKKKGTYWDNPGFSQNDRHPVTCVSWNDVQKFIRWLNRGEDGSRYRLPTEAEWEYACRAGTRTARFWGDDPDDACRYANVNDQTSKRVNKFGWENHNCNDGYAATAPAGNFKPNVFGLYDMLGNVWEWCGDWYGKYPSGQVTDPDGSSGGLDRVFRGGGWDSRQGHVRCARRLRYRPGYGGSSLGFRLLRTR